MERSEERDPESGQRALDESRPSSSVGITTSAFNPTPSPGEGIAGGKLARMAVGESEMNIAHASLNSKICLHSLFIQNRKKKWHLTVCIMISLLCVPRERERIKPVNVHLYLCAIWQYICQCSPVWQCVWQYICQCSPMWLCVRVHLSVFTYVTVCVTVHLSVFTYVTVCVPVNLSVFTYVTVCVTVHLSVFTYATVCVTVHLSLYTCVHLSVFTSMTVLLSIFYFCVCQYISQLLIMLCGSVFIS